MIYEPELGQAAFGQPWQHEPADAVTTAMLEALAALWARVRSDECPFSNTGARFDHALLQVHAYSWNDEVEQPWNLAWRDWRVSWYKHAARGVTQNRALELYEVAAIWNDACAAFGAQQASAAGTTVTPFTP